MRLVSPRWHDLIPASWSFTAPQRPKHSHLARAAAARRRARRRARSGHSLRRYVSLFSCPQLSVFRLYYSEYTTIYYYLLLLLQET